ncbi:hypothetical protein CPT03_10630 [Pedobacter ginsengisoli]|uniref:ORC1/DEAH AAA+ ATPase domain-containing protein n=1 Tax=Pedobacter ginsengisoli TaxID=363852 RepID=A0A2D1U5L8_9SPHI|nr:AAA family ATPase [Pedobacter ginsengisoli]ATP56901.1 hypothetical protein CPT03_10630 [Pedobacter ginsengisoli]
MNFFLRIFKTINLADIFTPNTVAKLTYVNREVIESDLAKYIDMPGKQIVVYGHSGSGKTTLLNHQLSSLKKTIIKVHCEKKTTFEDIILQAFDNLNQFYLTETTSSETHKISTEYKSDYKAISAKIGSEQSLTESSKLVRIVPPQLTPQKLGQFLGLAKCILVIEDFHKVADKEKQRIADVVKIFIDVANDYPTVKIVCIGAVGTARELIELDNNLNNRIAEVFVPLLSDEQITRVVEKGSELLNIKIGKELTEKIIYYSNNLGSVAHQICYDICFYSGIKKMRLTRKELKINAFKDAVNSYVRKNSDTYNKIYDQIINKHCGWNVLKKFDNAEKEFLSFDEIFESIPKAKSFSKDELIDLLSLFISPEFGEVLRHDRVSMKYSISTPFFRAYLKMKLALEKSEMNERNKKKSQKRNKKFAIEDSDASVLIYDKEFFDTYYQHLDTYLIRKIHLRNEIISNVKRQNDQN